ncbi:MAG: thioredoxin family protein [Chthonomonadales bacterium]|nr:thioredoxin family protein [Chthonomonadales bacterium]
MKPGAITPAKIGLVLLLLIAIVAVAQMKPGKQAAGGTGLTDPSPPTSAPGVPRMLELGSVSCIPCKMMKPVMEELEKEYGPNLKVDFIDVWQDPEAGRRYGVESIPTQILYDADGKEVFRHVGFWPKDEIVAAFAANGVELKKQ